MSDLLGRLISRAKGVSSTVEPILASRYEAPRAFDALPVLESGADGGLTSKVQNAPRASDQPREAVRESRQDLDSYEEPKPTRIQHDFNSDDRDGPVRRSVPALLRVHPPRTPRQPASPGPVEQAPSMPSAAEPPSLRGPAESRAIVETVVEERKPRTDFAPIATIAEDRLAPMENLPVMVRRADERTPHQPSHAATPARRAGATRPVEPEPVEVQVTIGHIEVRAAAPALAPPPRVARQGPGVSLDDYLRRRNGVAK
jgi:hypothetical protein